MKILEKCKRIPYRLNRQPFHEDHSCITNLHLVTAKENYFRYMTDEERKKLRKELSFDRAPEEKVIAHTYWYGEVGRKQAFSILSYLATQDLNKTEVWLWLDEENGYKGYEQNEYLKELLPYIKVKCYNPVKELKGIRHFRTYIFTQNFKLPYRADAFRLLILYKYGGLYFDMDVCFLDDILPVCGSGEWGYAWEKQAYANNALLYFKNGKESKLIRYLFRKAQRKAPMPWAVFHYTDKKLKDFILYPYQLFDPAWLNEKAEASDEFLDAFFLPLDENMMKERKISSYRDFYPGAFAYHWHNRWKMPEYDHSCFGMFEKEFKKILQEKKEKGK